MKSSIPTVGEIFTVEETVAVGEEKEKGKSASINTQAKFLGAKFKK